MLWARRIKIDGLKCEEKSSYKKLRTAINTKKRWDEIVQSVPEPDLVKRYMAKVHNERCVSKSSK